MVSKLAMALYVHWTAMQAWWLARVCWWWCNISLPHGHVYATDANRTCYTHTWGPPSASAGFLKSRFFIWKMEIESFPMSSDKVACDSIESVSMNLRMSPAKNKWRQWETKQSLDHLESHCWRARSPDKKPQGLFVIHCSNFWFWQWLAVKQILGAMLARWKSSRTCSWHPIRTTSTKNHKVLEA